jgi:hypothetical protein
VARCTTLWSSLLCSRARIIFSSKEWSIRSSVKKLKISMVIVSKLECPRKFNLLRKKQPKTTIKDLQNLSQQSQMSKNQSQALRKRSDDFTHISLKEIHYHELCDSKLNHKSKRTSNLIIIFHNYSQSPGCTNCGVGSFPSQRHPT